jgi:phosphopantothenoylcysteine decarboxylase/phosphopantothenate--cysteine ligase
MAAAVADYTPAHPEAGKLERATGERVLRLTPTPDLVAGVARRRRPGQRIVAFALEPAEAMLERAAAKLARKGVDAIVANPLHTPDADTIDAAWLTPAAAPARPGPMPKADFADWLLDRLTELAD